MQNTEFKKRELTVALLLEDAQSAVALSGALRSLGIFAHFYRELDEFWMAVKVDVPDLAIVDVTKMSFGATRLKDHPRMKDGSLCAAFFYKPETQFLLQSTFALKPFAFINGDVELEPQVLAMTERRRQELALSVRARELAERVERLQARSARLIGEKNESDKFKAHFEFVDGFMRGLEEEARTQDFQAALLKRFSDWAPVKRVAMYELAQNRQKLMSPQFQRAKWLNLPGLWIGKECSQGMEPFVLDMAWQVVSDLFESEPVELKLLGGVAHPELVVYVEVDQERLLEFPWDLMGQMLTASWRRWRLSREVPKPRSQAKPVWEALDDLDRLHHQQVESSEKVLLLSLTPLLALVKRKAQNRYHFTAMYTELFLKLGDALHETTRTSFFGPWHVLLFVQQPFLEREFNQSRDVLASFPFWKYFDDETRVMGEEARPSVKLIAPSAVNYLRTLEREFDELPILEAQARLGQRSFGVEAQ